MRAAATLLSKASSVADITEALRATGLPTDAIPLDDRTRDALGLDGARQATLGAGAGSLRVLVLELDAPITLRDSLHRVARRLAARAAHVLWLVGAVDVTGAHAGIVAWSMEGDEPRVVSLLWEPQRVMDSDAETLCALAAIRTEDDGLAHARWVEVLGRGALTRRFYRALDAQVTALGAALPLRVPADDGRRIALLYATRLLFLSFLEAKGWLDGDRAFIAGQFEACMRTGGHFHRRVLRPLFFGTLNTPASRRARAARAFGQIPFLNGGLFMRTPLECRAGAWCFPDEHLGALLAGLLLRFRFVAREDSETWSEASIDPEMLGRAFESLMSAPERRSGGTYYTPHDLVSRVAEHGLSAALRAPTLRAARELRVLDPACGSGAFLVYVLERLAALRQELGEAASTAEIRRDVLARSIFGVDRDPTAVWLCELRLWLSVVIESGEADPGEVPPLPNLDRNIRVGDALSGSAFTRGLDAVVGSARISGLRQRYVRATGVRKRSLSRLLDREERRRILAQLDREIAGAVYARREGLAAARARDLFGGRMAPASEARQGLKLLRDRLRALRLERRRVADDGALPFSFGAFFADAQAAGGFDVVLGNPPWVRLHRIPSALRLQFKRSFEVYRSAAWLSGAATARAAPGFSSQVDLAALFVERSVDLLRDRGTVALLLPVKLWYSLAGGGLRQLLLRRTSVVRLDDLSESKHAFDAAVYPSLLVARAGSPEGSALTLAIHDRTARREWEIGARALAFDDTPGAPWILVTPEARSAFDRVRAAGNALALSSLGAPRLGVKSGCNSAFIVRVTDTAGSFASIVNADGDLGCVELSLLRPALRGDAVRAWTRSPCDDWIIWTHDERGFALSRLPDRARDWLRRRHGDLTARSDAARTRRWWSLFRVDAAASRAPRVVWADFGRRPRALVLPTGDATVPLNTCYVLPCQDETDAWALAALLNSRLAAAWLNALAEPARGGYRRYLGWTVGQLPVPHDWNRARAILSSAKGLDDDALLEAVLSAYRLQRSAVGALLDWAR